MYFSIVNLIQKSILQCTRYMVPPPKALPVGHHATLKWRNSGFESNLCVFYRLLLDCIDMHRVFTHFQPNFSPHLYILYGNSTCGAPKHAIARHSCVHACLWCAAMGQDSRCDHLFHAQILHNGWYVWNNSHLKVICADRQSPDWSQLGGRYMAPHGALDGSKQRSAAVVRNVTWFDILDMHWLAACVSQI